MRNDHKEGYHISYCFRVYMIGESLGIEIKAPLLAETNCMHKKSILLTTSVDEKELDLSYTEFKRITKKEDMMTVADLQREFPTLPTSAVIQPLIRVRLLLTDTVIYNSGN